MKVGVLSDTHRNYKFLDKILFKLKECDLIIHAGDNFIDSKYIHKMTGTPVMAVKGNCDFENVEDEIDFDLDDKKIFVCHGDKYGVKHGIEQLHKKAKSINASIVVFGHTHTPLVKEKDNILYINPGSLSLPRGVEYRSWVILEIIENKVDIKEIKL